ncbi:MAG: Tripartite DNA replication factor [Chrysothrix sp. TS-e1954]|nr:MAG: Tripartite DNA replication factor [Chrysothrix sp. TS-e1954]
MSFPVLGRTNGNPQVKAFQFIEGRPSARKNQDGDDNNDKENIGDQISFGAGETKDSEPNARPENVSLACHTSSQTVVFPSTPGTRMPLADLVGDTDENRPTKITVEESPEDQISWHTVRSPGGSQVMKTPARRSQKRARSSSPPPSTAKRAKMEKESLDMKALRQSLKTPQTDPAAELWHRYATGTAKDTPLPLHNVAFAKLIESSSPYTGSDNLGNVSGLRRWTSCGVEWPTSKAKRQKTRQETIREQVEDVFADPVTVSGEDAVDRTKTSHFGSLLERIQESLLKSPEKNASEPEAKAPSSSSPLPVDGAEKIDREAISPCRASDLRTKIGKENSSQKDGLADDAELSSSSTFGGEDLCSDMLKEAAAPHNSSQSGALALETSAIEVVSESKPRQAVVEEVILNDEQEEFGPDLDFSEEDFEQIVASRPQSTANPAASTGKVEQMPTSGRALVLTTGPCSDDFDDGDVDEETLAALEAQATQTQRVSGSMKPPSEYGKPTIQRYKILELYTGLYTTEKGEHRPEKVLLVEDGKTKINKAITLRQSWYDTRCEKGSFVHVIGAFSDSGQCLIDDTHNMLILHPDHLISALVVADSFGCLRRAVLQDRIKATSEASPPQIYGTMLHEIFQECIAENRWDQEFLSALILTIISKHFEDLYEVNLNEQQVVEHLQSKTAVLQSWAETFVRSKPGPTASINDRNGKKAHMSVNKLLDIEEHIWSPMYGLKGNIDATIQVSMKDEQGERTLTVPLEIKTGMNSTNASHRAQTALYTLLLSDRYDVAIAYGILYYMEKSEISRIPAIRHEIRHMIMQRNELACSMRQREALPPMLKNPHTCDRCYAKTPCFIYHKLTEGGDGDTSGLKEKFDSLVRHLSPAHQVFFSRWDSLLSKEESEMMKFRRELWTMLSKEREKLGRCFANVSLVPGSESEEQGNSKINRYRYVFKKYEHTQDFSFTTSQITTGEPIVISDEKGHYALAKGYVVSVTKRSISVAVDRRLHNQRIRSRKFDHETNQSFCGMMNVSSQKSSSTPSPRKRKAEPMLFRLDKDEFSNGLAAVRNNLIQIMRSDVFHADDIRRLVVDLEKPTFRHDSTSYELSGPQSQMSINNDQRAAIEKIMSAQDYALVLGMPGTGKTTTIAHIIRALVAKGKSVLLTSYTHTAVDNILLKIQQDEIDILRIGAIAKVHPEVQTFARLAASPKGSIAEVEETYTRPKVVATTCLGINHPIFNTRIFDYCIVDEASQITLPVCLGPIRMARTFVLVGDHNQLPPLVQNREALSGGLDISLFRLLCETHPEAVASLRHQYRMNEEIMSLSNALIYGGSLVCGSEKTATKRLDLPFYEQATSQLHRDTSPSCRPDFCWLQSALSPTTAPPALFLNTDTLFQVHHEVLTGSRLTNVVEANLITQLARMLLLSGVSASSMGIITLYRSQLALIKTQLTSLSCSSTTRAAVDIEAHTADRFQGRDKDVILLSCVRSNDSNTVGDLLKDWRRVNVALTRAKSKLIIVGSKGTLSRGDELLAKLVKMLEGRKGGLLDLPPGAEDLEQHGMHLLSGLPASSTSPSATRVDDALDLSSSPSKEKQSRNASPSKQKRPVSTSKATGPATTTARPPLAPRSANANAVPASAVRRPFKAPAKTGIVNPRVVLGASKKAAGGHSGHTPTSSILEDILNDVVGEGVWD